VFDTSLYRLPAGDSLLFGQRVSSFAGRAGTLPGYREFTVPFRGVAEASLGSYLSPRALIRGDLTHDQYDVGGGIDYSGTEGHRDSAEANGILLELRGGLILGDTLSPLRRFRVWGNVAYQGENYYLYGNTATPFDRSRRATSVGIGLKSEGTHPISYDARIVVAHMAVDDRGKDSVVAIGATEPSFSLAVQTDVADNVRGEFRVAFATSSLQYDLATQAASSVSLSADVEWSPTVSLLVRGGLLYASGKNSDSGSANLVLPRIGLRYAVDERLMVFGDFSPHMRPSVYQTLLREAPYVDREITLRAERVPVRLVGGLRYTPGSTTLEGRVFYESGTNRPVVVADTGGHGVLRYEYVRSTTVGVEGWVTLHPFEDIRMTTEGRIVAAKADSLNRGLPMHPTMELRGTATWRTTPDLETLASLLYLSEQRVRLVDEETLGTRVLLNVAAVYNVAPQLDIFAEVSNLLGVSYDSWAKYSAPGFEVRGGARYRIP